MVNSKSYGADDDFVLSDDEFILFSPSSVNLFLHVTGLDEGRNMHNLDTLIVFSNPCDIMRVKLGQGQYVNFDNKSIDPVNNTVSNTLRIINSMCGKKFELGIDIVKNIPIASGIGGSSTNAATIIFFLMRYMGLEKDIAMKAAKCIGDEVHTSINCEPILISSDQCHLCTTQDLDSLHILLVNPGVGLKTADVFARYKSIVDKNFAIPSSREHFNDKRSIIDFLVNRGGNYLQNTAIAMMPEINNVLTTIKSTKPLFSRMSGSGTTCFGVFNSKEDTERAQREISRSNPSWLTYCTTVFQNRIMLQKVMRAEMQIDKIYEKQLDTQ